MTHFTTHPARKSATLRALLAATALVIVGGLSAPASAQSMTFSAIDTDDDRVLSYAELVAAFGQQGALKLLRDSDDDGDDELTVAEIRASDDADDQDDGDDDQDDRDDRDDRDDDRDDRDDDRDDRDDDNDEAGDDDSNDDDDDGDDSDDADDNDNDDN